MDINENNESIDFEPEEAVEYPADTVEEPEAPVCEEPEEFTENDDAVVQAEEIPEKKAHPFWRRAVAAVLALTVLGTGCGLTYAITNARWEQRTMLGSATIEQLNRKIDSLQSRINATATRGDVVNTGMTADGAMSPKQIYANYADSVVAISATVKSTTYSGQTTTGTSTGSGFILTDNGYVVTNHHVIDGATAVKVIMSSKEEHEAKIIGYDSVNDVAVLKIEAENLPAVQLGSSDELSVGDFVVAIGNPLGSLTATMTYGIVSGKNREVTTDSNIINMIQTDAAINSGNSGGPLFNIYGEVVGITSAKYSGTTSSGASIEGIGFAIPIDDVMSIIGDLRDFGYVTGAYLGVTVQDTDAAAASLYGLPTGAYVVTVVEGNAASKAGIQEKDIIIALGDYEVANVSELTRALRRFKAGDVTTVTVIRAGERKTLTITLDEKPRDLDAPAAKPAEDRPTNGDYDEWYKYFFGDGKNGG